MTRFLTAILALMLLSGLPFTANATATPSQWLDLAPNWQAERLDQSQLDRLQARKSGVALTGGVFWHALNLDIEQPMEAVFDFSNSSVIGQFSHWLFNAEGELLHYFEGGIQNSTSNPFFLRHGRPASLEAGQYQLISRLSSPFFLAQPEPRLFERERYQQSIKVGNSVTLLGLGIFFALGFYYIVLGTSRGRAGDLLYAGFILGNLLYNGTALLFFSDVLKSHQFYLISFPILLSNIAYIAFVMVLLNINQSTSRWLYFSGLGIIALFAAFFVTAWFKPSLSLELCRIGVGIFAIYGLTAGVVRILQGNKTARYYIIANIAFVIPALISIRASTLPIGETLFIEHIGLFAVAVEVILLSLVISHQVGMVYREKEAGLLATQEALLAANQALETKERFLANVSHELRTPLNAIQGSVELIGQYPLAPKVSQHIDAIHASSNFLLYLINDILDLAKMNADQLRLVKEPFDLDKAIDELASIYKNAYNRSRVTFVIDMDAELPTQISGDENRLKQVLANLLSNAFKFTEEGEVRLRIQRASGEEIRLSVSDTGIGIGSDKLHTVFSAFTQADASIARKYGGTGLGLQIASKLVRMMGGNLGVTSEIGEGSDFHFRLRLPISEQGPLPSTGMNVGLICNDISQEAIVQQDLQHYGIKIIEVWHPDHLGQQPLPDAILHWMIVTDTYIPGLTDHFNERQTFQWFVNYLDGKQAELWQGTELELLPYSRSTLPHLFRQAELAKRDGYDPALLNPFSVIAIDDNEVNLKVLMGMLSRLKIECNGFDDPEEAIAHILSQSPDLVLMDVQMPKMDGLEATRLLRSHGFTKPIIAFTANASEQDMNACRGAGMDDILVKPIRLEELRLKLNHWVTKGNHSERH